MRSSWIRLAAVSILLAGHLAAVGAQPDASPPGVTSYAIPDAQAPRDPWPHSDGGIYFSMAKSDRIVRFDIATRQFRQWPLPAGARPHGVTVARDGTIFYAGYGDGTIGEIDPQGGKVRRHRLALKDARPYSLAFDARGNVWVTARAGAVAMLDRATGKVREWPMDGEPYALAFDRSGMLWVTCIEADKVRALDPKTGAVQELPFERGSKPRRMAVGTDGRVWISLYGTGRLVAIDSATIKLLKTYPMPGGPNAGPYSVNVAQDGSVWVTEFQTDRIAILEPVSGTFRTVAVEPRSGIRNASFDAQGRYWFIASATGKIGLAE